MAGRYTSYDELPDVERQKVAQFAAGNAGGNANVSRALQALSANPAYALQMMQRAGLNAGVDSTTSDSARETNWSDTVNRSMQDGGADIAPGPTQTQSTPVPPARPSNLRVSNAGGNGGNAAGEEHTVVGGYVDNAPQPPRRPQELGGAAPASGEGEDSGYGMSGIIMAALAAAAAQQMAARNAGRTRGPMQLPPEAGGAAPIAQNRFDALEGPQEQRLLAGPQPKLMPPGTEDVVDAEYRDVAPQQRVEAEERKALPKPEAKPDSEKTLDKTVDDGEKPKSNRRERAAKAVRDSTRKVKLKK